MVPVLFTVAGLPVPTHEFFIGLGLVVAGAVFVREARGRGEWTDDLWIVVLGALIGGGLFARLGTGVRYVVDAQDPTLIGLVTHAGRSILGGLVGAYIGAVVAKRLIGYTRSTGDYFAPAVAIGMAVGRAGCFLTEQIGTTTSLAWGISVSSEQAARMPFCPQCQTGLPMHPSFLYEIAFHIGAFAVLMWLKRDPTFATRLLPIYIGSYAVFRFALEFVRGNPEMWMGFTGSQVFLLAGFGVAVAAATTKLRRRRLVAT